MLRGLSFDVCGDLYASQFEVRSDIRNAGGLVCNIKNEWSSSLPTYVLSSQSAISSGTNDKVLKAQELKVPILDSHYVRDSLAAKGLLPIAKYQLWGPMNGEQPVRPRPSTQPPAQLLPKKRPDPAPESVKPVSQPAKPDPPTTSAAVAAPQPAKAPAPVPAAPKDQAAPPPSEQAKAAATSSNSSPPPQRSNSEPKVKQVIKKVPKKKETPVLDVSQCTFHVSHSLQHLPAWGQRELVLGAISSRKCTLITGSPGCGKSSVVPQLVVDAGIIPEGKQVVCVQPHQNSAVSMGEYVAQKRLKACGTEVGYQIRFVNQTGPNTRLVYATPDLLLRRLQIDPGFTTVGCLILDGIHVRDLQMEYLMAVVRDMLKKKGCSIKLVMLGNSTADEEGLAQFFKPSLLKAVHLQCTVPHVTEQYLEDAMECTSFTPEGTANGAAGMVRNQLPAGKSISERTVSALSLWKEGTLYHTLIQDLVLRYHLQDKPGAILIFLPEWNDVALTHSVLLDASKDLVIIALHSTASDTTLQRAFAPAPLGKRKVILSTSFAEAMQFKDVKYVINAGVSVTEFHDAKLCTVSRLVSLMTRESVKRVSQACQEGTVVHLFPSWKLEELPGESLTLRNLDELVLQCKVTATADIQSRFGSLLSPLPNAAIANAIKSLQNMHALSMDEQSTPTPLGCMLARLPVPPVAAKLLFWGAALRVLKPAAVLAAFLTLKTPFMHSPGAENPKLDCGACPHSDHHALLQAYAGWQAAEKTNDLTYCVRHALCPETLEMVKVLVTQFVALMMDANYAGPDCEKGSVLSYATLDKMEPNCPDLALVNCCLAAACLPNTCCVYPPSNGAPATFVAPSGAQAHPHWTSVQLASPKQVYSSEWLVYSELRSEQGKLQFMDSTVVGHKYAVLFCRSLIADGSQLWLDGWRASVPEGQQWEHTFTFRQLVNSKFQECIAQRDFELFPDELVDEVLGYVTENPIELSDVRHPGAVPVPQVAAEAQSILC